MGRNLMAKAPRVMLSTFNRSQKAALKIAQKWMNEQIERTKMEEALQRAVLDALFSIGICKVAIADPADSAVSGWEVGAGTPFCQTIDLDDFVYDMHARRFSECSFIGHRYRAPLDVIKDSKLYSKARKKLEPTTDTLMNQEGDERINVLGRSTYTEEEFEDFVDLWEIYLPRHRLVLTLADQQMPGDDTGGLIEPLREQKWLGPYCGPYHFLGYCIIPGNAMPGGPIQNLSDLNSFINRSWRKIERQSDRQKTILAFAGSAEGDAQRVTASSDGEAVRFDNPEKVRPVDLGGANQQLAAMFMAAKQLFTYMAGNLDMMGGLSPQSKTLGQDRMLEENSSRTVADMQARTVNFVSDVMKAMVWYWWNDPFRIMKTTYSVQGLPEASIQRQLGPEQRQLSFEELNCKVDPYSMSHSTPQSKLANLDAAVAAAIPIMPLLAQSGVMLDMSAYMRLRSELTDMPELTEIFTVQEPIEQQGSSEGPGMSPETTRNYVRTSQPGRTQRGDEQNMINTLMGVDPGGAERNGKPMPAMTE